MRTVWVAQGEPPLRLRGSGPRSGCNGECTGCMYEGACSFGDEQPVTQPPTPPTQHSDSGDRGHKRVTEAACSNASCLARSFCAVLWHFTHSLKKISHAFLT